MYVFERPVPSAAQEDRRERNLDRRVLGGAFRLAKFLRAPGAAWTNVIPTEEKETRWHT